MTVPKKPGKAKPHNEKKRTRDDLPLDDLRWLPVDGVHKLLAQRIGNKNLAAADLTEAMSDVRCMRRSARSGVRELVPVSLWRDHQFESWDRGLLVIPRPPTLPAGELIVLRRRPMWGWLFYVWEPDVAKRWPELQTSHRIKPPDQTEERRGRDPKFTAAQTFALQSEYQQYKERHGSGFKKQDANEHLRRVAKDKFGIVVQHPDTIRDHVMKPVDDPGFVEK